MPSRRSSPSWKQEMGNEAACRMCVVLSEGEEITISSCLEGGEARGLSTSSRQHKLCAALEVMGHGAG